VTGRGVDLLVPMKSLSRAKSRLRGAADDGVGDAALHARLTIALGRDTVAAAVASPRVREVIVITSDPRLTALFAAEGVTTLADLPEHDLNGALAHGARTLRARPGRPAPIAALQGDLPALRAAELTDALDQALSAFRAGVASSAFCTDAQGDGTTLLVASRDTELAPRFGEGSALAHEQAGALRLAGDWPGLRRDVDRPEDLRQAAELGLGPATEATLRTTVTGCSP
jgi:2-phospho-L-lactate/phosphoenolpyruvate guanylyltransferase